MTDQTVTVPLSECPPGPFLFNGSLGFKTEYGAMETVGPTEVPGSEVRWTVGNRPDAYCMDSGEYFWGGATTKEERDALMVEPVSVAAAPLVEGGEVVAADWLPIETAPLDGTVIQLFCPQGDGSPGSTYRVTAGEWFDHPGGTTEYRDADGRWIGQDDEAAACGWISMDGGFSEETMMPTHWQPLASPPVKFMSRAAPPQAHSEAVIEALREAREVFAEIVTRDIHHSGPNIDTDEMKVSDVSTTWIGELGRLARTARNRADAALAAAKEPAQAKGGL